MLSARIQTWCALAGPGALAVALVGWLIAGILPVLPAADDDAAQIAAFYADGSTRIRIGLALAIIGISGMAALVAAVSVSMLRMEGRTPTLAFVQLVSGAVTCVLLVVPLVVMNVAAFRPGRTPEITMTLNDLAWILFIPPVGPFLVQNVAIAGAVFTDSGHPTVLPRWVAYANLWVAFLFLPGVLSYFFTSGPFAWQGIFSFWLALTAYVTWAVIMAVTIRASLLREAGSTARVG